MRKKSGVQRRESAPNDRLSGVVRRLDRLRFASHLSFERNGQSIVAAVSPATHEPGKGYRSRIWKFGLNGSATQLTHGPNADDLPCYSPVDNRIAFISDRDLKDKMVLFLLDKGKTQPRGDIPGTIEDLRWTPDGTALIALAADRGLDGTATNGAVRLSWGEPEDPQVNNQKPRRRLFKVAAADGTTAEVGPSDYSVWEFDLIRTNGAIAIVSADASERGWYHASLAQLDFRKRRATIIHTTRWQLQSPVVAPSGGRVAFVEGWSSDRGLVASEIRVLDLKTGKLTTLAAAEAANVTRMTWRDDKSLWFAGWSKLGSIYGIIGVDGRVAWSQYEDAIIGTNSFAASLTPAPDKLGFAVVRETTCVPPEIVFKTSPDVAWKSITRLNRAVGRGFPAYPEVRPLRWRGQDRLELEGLVLLPPDARGPLPMVVDIHGGPSWAAKYAFNPGYALPFTAAGYAVFLPNYRGNAGWGQAFAKLNIGDPAGAEFADILRGVDACVADGYCRSRPAWRNRGELRWILDRLGGGGFEPVQGRRHG